MACTLDLSLIPYTWVFVLSPWMSDLLPMLVEHFSLVMLYLPHTNNLYQRHIFIISLNYSSKYLCS